MKLLLMIVFLPLMLVFNLIGMIAALVQVSVVNGYVLMIEYMEKISPDKD